MASSPSTEKSEDKKIEEDGGKDGNNHECQMIDVYRERPSFDSTALKKDNCAVTKNSLMSSKSDDDDLETKSKSVYMNDGDMSDSEMKDADVNNSVCVNDGPVPEQMHTCNAKYDFQQMFINKFMEAATKNKGLSQVTHDDEVINGEHDKQDDKDEVMSIDRDEPSATEAQSTLTLHSGANIETISSHDSNHTGSPGTKRISTDEDDESPKPKRHTPDRSDDKTDNEDTTYKKKDANETNSAEPDQSKELPSLSSDSDDDDDDDIISTPAGQRRLLRRRRLRRRRFGRQRLSSDESDTTDDDDTNDGMKNTDEDDEKESDEVQKALSEILNKPAPKPNWYAVSELRKREYGYTSPRSSSSFM